MSIKNIWTTITNACRHQLALEPNVLFPLFATLVLAILWWGTLNVIATERNGVRQSAAASSRELAETYEAQILRVLREIDQTLKLVQYAYRSNGEKATLSELRGRDLLPPDILFAVSILNLQGEAVASTRPTDSFIANDAHIQVHRHGNNLYIAAPQQKSLSGDWKLQFSRPLKLSDGTPQGVVVIEVDAAFFVSSYDASKLGEQGLLGIVGTDGIFRARRTGSAIFAGHKTNYYTLVPETDSGLIYVTLATNPWDGVRRYTAVRELYDFPLAVVVGLGEAEQLEPVNQRARTALWRATAGSVGLLLIIAIPWRLSHQLTKSRQREIEAQITHAEQIEYLAYHDGLTDLPNRSLLSKLLDQSINQAQRYRRKLAVLFLDLDHFKQINDTLGHEAGDQLLQEVAQRLKSCLRNSDTVARLGGDEFVVVLPELAEEAYVTTVARKIISTISKPFTLRQQEFRVTASIGISTYPQDGQDEETLTKNADIAMYQAKEEGKNNFQFYSEKLHSESLERLTLESSLQHALERNEFEVHYQAKRDVQSGEITGVEALLRWQHPDLGTVAPMQFIPIAEECGLIVPIGKWVLKVACQQNMAWRRQGLRRLSMAVNLSQRQFFDTGLATDIIAILAETGMEANLLELEITESLLLSNVHKALQVMNTLKEIGVRIVIDDFGVGYSSLSMLKQFPLDAIKIDRTLIQEVPSVTEDKTLTEAIVTMGRTLSLTVVAQGVETKEQADFLRDHACNELQGFYFNKPVPANEFEKELRLPATIASADVSTSDPNGGPTT